nr:nodulin MtN21 /EamA-like transporter family protein [Tanacetum cinerariifolium]
MGFLDDYKPVIVMLFLQLTYAANSLLSNLTESDNRWLLGCLCLFAGCCCWSFWLIIQVPITRNYPDHLSLSAWMCFIGTVQCGMVALFTDPYMEAWKINSVFQLGTCLYAGIVGSGISICAQAWVIERRGPVFSAMFNPLNTVIVTIFASIFLQEQIYFGSVIGALGIITGLYVVLWGKAKDVKELKEEQVKQLLISENDQIKTVPITRNYPDHLYLSTWMCFIETVLCGMVALFTDPYMEAWKINSAFQLGTCLYARIVGSGISIFAQAWVIERRGALGIITGLYVVLWGKAKDVKDLKEEQAKQSLISQNDQIRTVQVMVDGSYLILVK